MARIKRCQATAGADSSTAVPAAATGTSSRPATALIPGYQQQHYQQQQTLSTDITEQQDVLGLGQFTAYADGRVRVLFADRTILNLTSDHGRVSLVMPDGSCRTVPAAKPLGVEQYVQVRHGWRQNTCCSSCSICDCMDVQYGVCSSCSMQCDRY